MVLENLTRVTNVSIATSAHIAVGNINSSGIITAVSYDDINCTGIVTAVQFFGDGSGLTNIAGVGTGAGIGLTVYDDGAAQGTVSELDFTTNLDVAVGGGIGTVSVSNSPSFSGTVGIGTTATSATLHVVGDSIITRVAITTSSNLTINLEPGRNYVYYSSNTTLNLPANPTFGDRVEILNRSNAIDSIVFRNGNLIMGFDEDLTVDLTDISFSLIYVGAGDGWVLGR